MKRRARWRGVAFVCCGLALAGCRTVALPAPVVPEPPPLPPDGNEFVVAETVNVTWNTIGQILVGLPGVTYETRAQMLALYGVRYRNESFLVRARGLPVEANAPGLRTRVDALTPGGAPLRTAATADLLGILGQRVPAEAPLYRERLREIEQAKAAAESKKKRRRGKKK